MLTNDLLPLLWCPSCQSSGMRAEAQRQAQSLQEGCLVCPSCGAYFPVHLGIPELIPQAHRPSVSWELWQDHLQGYRARAEHLEHRVAQRTWNRWNAKTRAFAAFVDPGEGRLLDVGCGSGKFRDAIGDATTTYVGLDPLPVRGVENFRFVQALAERIPFRDGAFTHIVVRSALDHFCELEGFLREAARVLTPDGRMYVEQVVHEIRGPRSALRYLAHEAKDLIDDFETREVRHGAPKHVRSFTTRSLERTLSSRFRIEREERYEAKWYLPTQLLLELRRR